MHIKWEILEKEDTFVVNERVTPRQIDIYEHELMGLIKVFDANVENPTNIRIADWSTGAIIKPKILSCDFDGEFGEFYIKEWKGTK